MPFNYGRFGYCDKCKNREDYKTCKRCYRGTHYERDDSESE